MVKRNFIKDNYDILLFLIIIALSFLFSLIYQKYFLIFIIVAIILSLIILLKKSINK